MFFLIDAHTGEVIQECEGSFEEFIENNYGGLFPYQDPVTKSLQTKSIFGWAEDDSKYWSKYPPESYLRRYICRRQNCTERIDCQCE